MHRIAMTALAACASNAVAQEFTITEQFRAIVVDAYAADFDGFIDKGDFIESAELFNFNENLFVEAELGGAAAVAVASQASLLDPDYLQVDCSMFTEAIAKGKEADASSYVENVGDMTFTIDQALTVVLAGTLTNVGGESCEMTVYLFDAENDPIYIVGIGGGETVEFSETIDLEPGTYRLVNEQFAEGLRTEEAIEGDATFSLSITGCAADCNGDGNLDILDFVCFQGLFQDGDPAADCNGDGSLDILDFVCFQAQFQAGC